MTTNNGLPIFLPEGYEDWVEVNFKPGAFGFSYLEVGGIRRCEVLPQNSTSATTVESPRYFVPPMTPPTLPDVKPGAVVRYVDRHGNKNRAILGKEGKWILYTDWDRSVSTQYMTLSGLLNDVNADGFTVELDGL